MKLKDSPTWWHVWFWDAAKCRTMANAWMGLSAKWHESYGYYDLHSKVRYSAFLWTRLADIKETEEQMKQENNK